MAETVIATGFPTIALDVLAPKLAGIAGVEFCQKRPLNQKDANRSIGIWGTMWLPLDHEIGLLEPAVSRYPISVQCLVKNTDEAEARAEHTELAKRIRRMLYRDRDLAVRFAALRDVEDAITERTARWNVLEQRFAANEMDGGDFWYLSTTEIHLDTETV